MSIDRLRPWAMWVSSWPIWTGRWRRSVRSSGSTAQEGVRLHTHECMGLGGENSRLPDSDAMLDWTDSLKLECSSPSLARLNISAS